MQEARSITCIFKPCPAPFSELLFFLLPGLKAGIWGSGPSSLENTKRICSKGFCGPAPGERQAPAENTCWDSLVNSR